ncbi:MAG: heme-binding protein [Acidobacteriota bacterium]|nr:heme-binding protein [Acidobacteriota bacterium]
MRLITTSLITLLLCLAVVRPQASQTTAAILDLAGAERLAGFAVAEARARQAGGSIAVVDGGGHLLFLERLDKTFPAAAAVSIEKARTAATFRVPTRNFEEAIKNGRHALLGVDVMTPLQGGVPVQIDGQVVGAIGVSGAHSAQEDDDIAQAAVTAFGRPGSVPSGREEAAYLKNDQVAAAFAKGAPLLETAGYKIHASRRVEAGQAEVHTRDTDIIYVLDGSVTFVTGGTVVDPHETGPDEIRGLRLEGGTARALSKGDVMVVPAGTPHWFSQVDETFLYYVVKATSPDPLMRGTR